MGSSYFLARTNGSIFFFTYFFIFEASVRGIKRCSDNIFSPANLCELAASEANGFFVIVLLFFFILTFVSLLFLRLLPSLFFFFWKMNRLDEYIGKADERKNGNYDVRWVGGSKITQIRCVRCA